MSRHYTYLRLFFGFERRRPKVTSSDLRINTTTSAAQAAVPGTGMCIKVISEWKTDLEDQTPKVTDST